MRRHRLPNSIVPALVAALLALMPVAGTAGEAFARHVYRPDPLPAHAPRWPGAAPVEVSATTRDGLVLRGYYWAASAPGGELLLFFHGNGGNRMTAAEMAAPLAREGRGVLVASYRGYGDHAGTPSEAGLELDGQAFLALARALAPESPVVLFGYSLGGAVALKLAATEHVRGVVTLGAFSSLAEVAPRLVARAFKGRFDNRATIARVEEPVLVLHGTVDEVVPFEQARTLQAAAPRARLLRLEGAPHRIALDELAPTIWSNIAQMPR